MNINLRLVLTFLFPRFQEGRCFVETAQLDGESNLKRRLACFDADNSGTQDYQVRLFPLDFAVF